MWGYEVLVLKYWLNFSFLFFFFFLLIKESNDLQFYIYKIQTNYNHKASYEFFTSGGIKVEQESLKFLGKLNNHKLKADGHVIQDFCL